jgi:CheY-like chemotaxis protein
MHQIIMNLATNAAHAMSGRPGRLTVRLASVEVDDRMVQAVPDLRTGRYVVLAISDTGCGMDKAILDRIFEPFFTTKAPGEGTGLGLSVVHGIVKSHDGAIAVQSQPGKGTTFQVYFPSQQTSDTEILHRSGSIPHGNGEQVLFVDDEPALAFLGKKLLERAGYHVAVQTSAPEALKVFRTEPSRYDLVVTDLTMPNLTGADLAGELLKIRPQLPIIMATGFSGSMNSAKPQALGVRELLMKPLTCQLLAESAHRVLAQKRAD